MTNHANQGRALLLMFAAAVSVSGQPEVIATGLQAPAKLILTPRGSFLVAETSLTPNAGRLSLVTRAGARQSFFEALPSGTEVAGGGSGPTGLALRERTLYVAIGAGDTERRSSTGASVHNPAGISSPIFNSILDIRLSADIDSIMGTFRLTPAQQQELAGGGEIELQDGAGSTARVSVLTDLPDSVQDGSVYRFSNLWALALSGDGAALWAIDASQNTLLRINTATGRSQRVMHFPALPNAGRMGPPMIDSVPTSARVYGDQLLVSFLTGFPFTPGYARVLAVNPAQRTTEPFIFGITSAVDVLWRARPDGSSQFFVLEFSQNQAAQPAAPGRLVRFDSPNGQLVASDLRAPVNLAFDPATEELFILELSGRILRVSAR